MLSGNSPRSVFLSEEVGTGNPYQEKENGMRLPLGLGTRHLEGLWSITAMPIFSSLERQGGHTAFHLDIGFHNNVRMNLLKIQ